MPQIRSFLVLVPVIVTLAAPVGAHAACPPAQATLPVPAPAPEVASSTRAAGDDVAVTPPDDPLCDGGGYDATFPDVPLETDVSPVVSGGGGGTLPVTGAPHVASLLVVAWMLVVLGLATHAAGASSARPVRADA